MSTATTLATLRRAGFSSREANAILAAFTTAPVPDAVGGGGAQLKWSYMNPAPGSILEQYVNSGVINIGTSTVQVGQWVESQIHSSIPRVLVQSTAGEFGWEFMEPGWYDPVLYVEAEFTANGTNPTALPDALHVDFTSWEGHEVTHNLPVVRRHQDTAGVQRVVRGTVHLGPYYSKGHLVETNEQSASALVLRYNGNALIGQIGQAATTSPRVSMEVFKIG